jgi:hypothetical protein
MLQAKLTEGKAKLDTSAERPVRVFCQDESRFGLLPIQRRPLTLHGVKPLGAVQYCFENFYVYGAVEPTTGENQAKSLVIPDNVVCLFLPPL